MGERDGRDRGSFEQRFAALAGPMMGVLLRRRVRAQRRAAALFRPEHEGETTPDEAHERARWLELEAIYGRAYDGVHAAMGFVWSAAVLLHKIREEQELVERKRQERKED